MESQRRVALTFTCFLAFGHALAQSSPQSCVPSNCAAQCTTTCKSNQVCTLGTMTSCGECPTSNCIDMSLLGLAPSSSSSGSKNGGSNNTALIGGIVGGVLGSILLVAIVGLILRRRRRKRMPLYRARTATTTSGRGTPSFSSGAWRTSYNSSVVTSPTSPRPCLTMMEDERPINIASDAKRHTHRSSVASSMRSINQTAFQVQRAQPRLLHVRVSTVKTPGQPVLIPNTDNKKKSMMATPSLSTINGSSSNQQSSSSQQDDHSSASALASVSASAPSIPSPSPSQHSQTSFGRAFNVSPFHDRNAAQPSDLDPTHRNHPTDDDDSEYDFDDTRAVYWTGTPH